MRMALPKPATAVPSCGAQAVGAPVVASTVATPRRVCPPTVSKAAAQDDHAVDRVHVVDAAGEAEGGAHRQLEVGRPAVEGAGRRRHSRDGVAGGEVHRREAAGEIEESALDVQLVDGVVRAGGEPRDEGAGGGVRRPPAAMSAAAVDGDVVAAEEERAARYRQVVHRAGDGGREGRIEGAGREVEAGQPRPWRGEVAAQVEAGPVDEHRRDRAVEMGVEVQRLAEDRVHLRDTPRWSPPMVKKFPEM